MLRTYNVVAVSDCLSVQTLRLFVAAVGVSSDDVRQCKEHLIILVRLCLLLNLILFIDVLILVVAFDVDVLHVHERCECSW